MENFIEQKNEDIFEVKLRNKIAQQKKLSFVGKFSPEGLAVARGSRKFHLINSKNERIISDKYGDEERENGFMIENSSLGFPKEYYINRDGDKVGNEFDKVEDFSDGVGLVKNNDKYFFVDQKGEKIIAEEYDFGTSSFRGGMAVICYDNKGPRYLIDKSGKKILEEGFNGASMYLDGLAWTVKNGVQRFFDRHGKEVAPKDLADLGFLSSPAFYDQNIAKILYDDGFNPNETISFRNGVAHLKNNDGKYYLFNEKYKKLLEQGFDQVHDFTEEGVTFAKLGDDWFLIDKKGNKKASFGAIQPFSDGIAEVYTKENPGKWFYVDKEGKKVFL